MMRIFLFVLTAFGVASLYGFCTLLQLPAGWVTMAISLAAAEWLILRHKFQRRGVEEALWICGLIAFIVSLPSSGKPEAILAFVAAFAIAGIRLRHEFFGTAAICLGIVYLAAKDWELLAVIVGVTIGVVAALLSDRRLFFWTAIAAPLTAYCSRANHAPDRAVIAIFAALAVVDLGIGIRWRQRAPLIAGAMSCALVAIEARELIDIAVEWKLLIAGSVLFAIATTLMRTLRNHTTGITVTPASSPEAFEVLEVAATLPLASNLASATPSAAERGGGEFGGAGASGDY